MRKSVEKSEFCLITCLPLLVSYRSPYKICVFDKDSFFTSYHFHLSLGNEIILSSTNILISYLNWHLLEQSVDITSLSLVFPFIPFY